MSNKYYSFFNLLTELPWWLSIVVAALTYVGLTQIVPNIETGNPIVDMVFLAFQYAGPFFAFIFLLASPFSYLNAKRKRKQLDVQKDINSIKALSWKGFEELVAEAYRRQGYRVIENALGPDGGIDATLLKDREVTLVQCKQWRSKNVGVSVVREMYGILTAKNAQKVIIICCGGFTRDTLAFAENKPIDLIGGTELLKIVKGVQANAKVNTDNPKYIDSLNESKKLCPNCGNHLVKRQAKSGANAGNIFFGCSSFPKCRFATNKVIQQTIQG